MKKWITGSDYDLIVIGGGAAGMFSAGVAAKSLDRILLLEKEPRAGKEASHYRKGRCNVTNDCTPEEALQNVLQEAASSIAVCMDFLPRQSGLFLRELASR